MSAQDSNYWEWGKVGRNWKAEGGLHQKVGLVEVRESRMKTNIRTWGRGLGVAAGNNFERGKQLLQRSSGKKRLQVETREDEEHRGRGQGLDCKLPPWWWAGLCSKT